MQGSRRDAHVKLRQLDKSQKVREHGWIGSRWKDPVHEVAATKSGVETCLGRRDPRSVGTRPVALCLRGVETRPVEYDRQECRR